ncbi:putative cyclin-D7-1 [Hibiscus syriacus]|uniref:putative cyclin-D7-1 n=1 Tax=Hibiscus syriacus TaxID=106335 RepID=UPI001922EFAF|nr:putative cyclin-D7-1 [Hibiscus syriacus]
MENLLCDEVWLSGPETPDPSHETDRCTLKEDSEQALLICLKKELSYMPEPGYLDYLQSNNLVFSRFRAVQWLIKTGTRLNLSTGTVFNAVNYLDRFISTSQCPGWKNWMVELLSIACLSIASKFNETSLASLDELQMQDLEHCFQSSTIQQMELMVLQALKWRLGSTTTYSYIELITINIIHDLNHYLHNELINLVNKTLVKAILDFKLLPYPPSVVAVSALRCNLGELIPSSYNVYITKIMKLISQDHEDDIMECRRIIKAWLFHPFCNLKVSESHYYPSSPVTVLLTERIDINDFQADLSLFGMPLPSSSVDDDRESSGNKRKREEE